MPRTADAPSGVGEAGVCGRRVSRVCRRDCGWLFMSLQYGGTGSAGPPRSACRMCAGEHVRYGLCGATLMLLLLPFLRHPTHILFMR